MNGRVLSLLSYYYQDLVFSSTCIGRSGNVRNLSGGQQGGSATSDRNQRELQFCRTLFKCKRSYKLHSCKYTAKVGSQTPRAVTSEGLRLRSEGASCVSTNSTASHLFFLFWIGIELMTLCLRGRRNATELNPWHPPTQSPIWRKTRPEDLGRTTQASPRVLSREETSHIHREPSLQHPQTRGAKKPRHI